MPQQILNIGIWVGMPDESAGGGFSYAMNIIREIEAYDFDDGLNFIFLSFPPYKEPYLKYIKKKQVFQVPNDLSGKAKAVETISNTLASIFPGSFQLVKKWKTKVQFWQKARHIAAIKENNIHLLFYPVQQQGYYYEIPFISNNFDLGHSSTYGFPEMSSLAEYEQRDSWYNSIVKKAFAVFTESIQGKTELIQYLSINPDKIKILSHFHSGKVPVVDTVEESIFLEKHSLEKNQFLFYPAQFWAHKNHYNLLIGFNEFLNDSGLNIKLIFTGSDQGNLDYIQKFINELQLNDRVKYLGFVSTNEISILYKNALSLIFPSFLGPSNLPLLEALYHDCFVLCSNLPGHVEMCGDVALYFDPTQPCEIADSIRQLLNEEVQERLKNTRMTWKSMSLYSSVTAMKQLEQNFMELKPVRMCWGA
jgi:glycosyltransferase involved in cell wall biosynthesis